ncbi:MAG: GNAT family N-acetyltransferase [Eubacteriaceae bacterium]|nr:GNAT family N-acetyltransferase [Eubacteriaceae bacterium]
MTDYNIEFTPLKESDIPELTPIMERSFDEDARLFFGKPKGGPEGYDDGSFLRKWALMPKATSYCIHLEGVLIGAIILFIYEGIHSGHLGCIFLDPEYCGRGLGTRVWNKVEAAYPSVKKWTTETPAVSYRNHRFYINNCGFHVVEVQGGRDRFEAQFKLEKVIG